ncbi:MAG TPA: hypothetical protein VMN57_06715 [Anaerolineales bacterium]|nr:hypothetical protein [Anaerolineales bacterium]
MKNKYGIVVAWSIEFIQNLPLVSAFITGYALVTAGRVGGMVAVVFIGVAIGALLIRYTEPRIVAGPIEKPAETIANLFFFTLAILGFIYYFSWKTASWPFDLALSIAVGIAASLIQARAAGAQPSARHSAAMIASFSAAVLLIRFWALSAPPFTAAIVLTAVVTTIIVRIEYVEKSQEVAGN